MRTWHAVSDKPPANGVAHARTYRRAIRAQCDAAGMPPAQARAIVAMLWPKLAAAGFTEAQAIAAACDVLGMPSDAQL